MRRNRRRLAAAAGALLVIVALVVGIVAGRGNGPARATHATRAGGGVAISGTDPINGKRVDLASFAGKPIVLNVWASWCPGCIDEAADLRRFAAAHHDVQVVGIDLNDSQSGARDSYRRWRWSHPSIADPNGEIAAKLGLQGMPTTYFLDREHRVVTQIVGATDLAGFNSGLQAALGS